MRDHQRDFKGSSFEHRIFDYRAMSINLLSVFRKMRKVPDDRFAQITPSAQWVFSADATMTNREVRVVFCRRFPRQRRILTEVLDSTLESTLVEFHDIGQECQHDRFHFFDGKWDGASHHTISYF